MNSLALIVLILGVATLEIQSKSLTFIVDGTYSFAASVDQVKNAVETIIDRTNEVHPNLYQKFGLVIVRDPARNIEKYTFRTKREVLDKISYMKSSGSSDCPEPILESIVEGIWLTDKSSSIFVFTDASPDNIRGNGSIKDIFIRSLNKNIQLNFFITGNCAGRNDEIFTSLSTGTNGHLFKMDEIILMTDIFKNIDLFCDRDYQAFVFNNKDNIYKTEHVIIDQEVDEMLVYVVGKNPWLTIPDTAEQFEIVNMENVRISKINFPRKPLMNFYIQSSVESGENTLMALIKSPVRLNYYLDDSNRYNSDTTDKKIVQDIIQKYAFIRKSFQFTPINATFGGKYEKLTQAINAKLPAGFYRSYSKFIIPRGLFQITVYGQIGDKTVNEYLDAHRLILPPIVSVNDVSEKDIRDVRANEPFTINCSTKIKSGNYHGTLLLKRNDITIDRKDMNSYSDSASLQYTVNEHVSGNTVPIVYQCMVDNEQSGKALKIRVKRNTRVVRVPIQNLNVKEGGSVSLQCQIIPPNPYRTMAEIWTLENNLVSKYSNVRMVNGSDLFINYISREQSGNYTCHGDDQITSYIYVNVLYPPSRPYFVKTFSGDYTAVTEKIDIYESEFSPLEIKCFSYGGNPKPTTVIHQSNPKSNVIVIPTYLSTTIQLDCESKNPEYDSVTESLNVTIHPMYKTSKWSEFKICQKPLRCLQRRYRHCLDDFGAIIPHRNEKNSRRFCNTALQERIRYLNGINETWLGYEYYNKLKFCHENDTYNYIVGKCSPPQLNPEEPCLSVGLKCQHHCIGPSKKCGCRQGFKENPNDKTSCIVDRNNGFNN